MIDFAELQELAKDSLVRDRAVQSVEAQGATLELAVADASTMLNIPVYRIEYEILERGFAGFMGLGKKNWHIQAYEKIRTNKKRQREVVIDEVEEEAEPVIEDRDGSAHVFLQSGGDVLLKVVAPIGGGSRVSEMYVSQLLAERNADAVDSGLVARTVREAKGVYAKVAGFDHHSYNDSVLSVRIEDGDMRALMTVSAPGDGGCDIPFEDYVKVLKINRVVSGIKEDFLRDFVDSPAYGLEIEVAVGTRPVDGKAAKMKYEFETDQSRARLKEGLGGKIDFKELNIIQNVMENQLLATKIPPQKGIQGETVTGTTMPAKNGMDITMPVGDNVRIGDDGATLYAATSGRAILMNNKVTVEPVLTVEKNVGIESGNIIFLGTVIVKGDVEDGFSVKAAGNIEVYGSIEKAELDAEGDIVIQQGVNGKGGGNIRAGRSLWARFIQNANIQAGNLVFASDGIINSNVDALARIICQGKRASIVGGRLRATEEINGKVLGNPSSGTETICEVGFDPSKKEELSRLDAEKEANAKELDEVKLKMQGLIAMKQQKKSLSDDKQVYLQELIDRRDSIIASQEELDQKAKDIKGYFAELKSKGKISASSKVFPGVKIVIRDVREEVRNEYNAVTFLLEAGLIRASRYEEPDKEAVKGPDGYSTN